MFADSLAKTLAGQGVDVERAGIAAAASTADVLLPDLIVLAADAAQSRGAAVLSQLQAADRTTATLVISAAEAGGLVPVQAAPHVAYLTPAGGVIDCAGRVRALLGALLEKQDAGASLQKLAEKVAGRAKTTTTGAQPKAAGPAKTSPGFPTPLSKAPEALAAMPATQPIKTAATRPTAGTAKNSAAKPNDAGPASAAAPVNKPASKAESIATPAKPPTGKEREAKETVPTLKVTHPSAAKLATPSAAPGSDKGVGLSKSPPLSAAKAGNSLGPSSARSLTNQPATAQPPAALSASPPARSATTQSLAAKPAATSNVSLPRGTTGQHPAAMSGKHGAALTTSPAPAPRDIEQPTLRPTAPGPQEPALHGAQTVRPATSPQDSPALPQKPANDQVQPPEVKTAPRIPLRAKRTASPQAPANDAATAAPPKPGAKGSADARQISDSEVEIVLSDRPVAVTPKLLPADTTPPPPKSTSGTSPDLRAQDTKPTPKRPQPTAAAAPRPNDPPTRTTGAIAPSIPASAARSPVEPAAANARANAPNIPANAARNPPEPPPQTNPRIRITGASLNPEALAPQPNTPAARTTGAIAPNIPADATRTPVDPASSARTTGAIAPNIPANAPRNPLDPAPQTNPRIRITGAIDQSRPAGASLNAPATRTTGAIAQSQSMPARAPRYPFESAPSADAARMTSGAPHAKAQAHTTGSVPRMPSGAPRHPFDPAPRQAEPTPSASVRNMPSGAPRYPFDPAPRAAEHTTGATPSMPSGSPRRTSVDPSGAPARAPRDPFAPSARTDHSGQPPSAAKRTGRAPTDPFQPADASQSPGLPDLALTTDNTAKPRSWRGAWIMGAVAAIGCSAFWLYQTYDSSAATAPGNAATGALSQTPPLKTLPVDHAAPPPLSPQPNINAPLPEPEPTTATPGSDRRTGSTRRAGDAPEADPTTAAGRARALVDSGSAMLRQGRYGIAEGMYMKALQEVPEYPPAMAELVRVHLARKDGKEAVRWAESLVAKQSNGLHQLLLGDAQALRGNHSAAEAAWTKAAKAGNATAQQRLAANEEEEEEE